MSAAVRVVGGFVVKNAVTIVDRCFRGRFAGYEAVLGVYDANMREDELEDIEELCGAASPPPWFVRQLDDDWAMGLVAVSTTPDTGLGERWPEFDHGEIIAATLVQQPRYVDSVDGLWDQNAAFIAMAREAVPRLVSEVRRLRALLAETDSHPSR
ncbi:hypothetical protein [Fodinicola feengrottensis]|uniref:Peptidase S74 domain-containing protein n=1 Tax=Fodinicola feengrottensis TaxID=435914 RepID=A0ABN2FZJ6_9ACTN|nr:hypothetical protein [Fodinicola feengrottensis]